jgi:hypothetical protein
MIDATGMSILECEDKEDFYGFILDVYELGNDNITRYFIAQMNDEEKEECIAHLDSLTWYDRKDDENGEEAYKQFKLLFN